MALSEICNLLHYYVDEGQHTLTYFPEYNLQKQNEDPKENKHMYKYSNEVIWSNKRVAIPLPVSAHLWEEVQTLSSPKKTPLTILSTKKMNNENNHENRGRKRFHLDAWTYDGYERKSHSTSTTGCCTNWTIDGKKV